MIEQITGTKELSRKLRAMGVAVGGKILRGVTISAALPALRAAQAAAPVGDPPFTGAYGTKDPYPVKDWKGRWRVPGNLKRNIVRRGFMSKDKTKASVVIGPRAIAFYGSQFLEHFGTSSRPARPWLEPSFRASIPAMNERMKSQLKARIDKAAKGK